MEIVITFDCTGFTPMEEDHIRHVILTDMERRGMFEKVEGRPQISSVKE